MSLVIRPEQPGDIPAIRETVTRAFREAGEGTGESEAVLIDAVRDAPGFDPELSLVAELDGRIIGHLLFSPCAIDGAGNTVPALALAPLSVLRGYEAHHAGTRLMRAGLQTCRDRGHRIVIVLGHAKYYRRFGFRPANQSGIHAPWVVPPGVFQALALVPGALDAARGTVRYPPAFDATA